MIGVLKRVMAVLVALTMYEGKFVAAEEAAFAGPPVEGRLLVNFRLAELEVLVDDAGLERPELRLNELPPFNFEYLTVGSRMYPAQPGPVLSDHPHWEYLLGVGRLEADSSGEARRMRLPVALQQRNANCVHNGLLDVRFPSGGGSSGTAAFSITAETCRYFKLNLGAEGRARYRNNPATGEVTIGQDVQRWNYRLPVKPFTELANDYPGADVLAFANPAVDPDDMSVFGLVMDGIHYLGGCNNRGGSAIPCEEWVLPSYSTAKSIFAGLSLMRLERTHTGASEARIENFVAECSDWAEVSFADALNMATGRYLSTVHGVDEADPRNDSQFFLPETHAEKIAYACDAFPPREAPGQQFVYHTTDTYTLGTAMQEYLVENFGAGSDVAEDLLLPLLRPLRLSPLVDNPKRTYDQRAQPWSGWGLNFLPDDIARLAVALGDGWFDGLLDPEMLDSALQRTEGAGLVADSVARYSNGFWALDLSGILECPGPVWMPYMSGFGGIQVAVLPGGVTYYYVSDGGVFDWTAPLRALHAIHPLC